MKAEGSDLRLARMSSSSCFTLPPSSFEERHAQIHQTSEPEPIEGRDFCADFDRHPDLPHPQCLRRSESVFQKASSEGAIRRCKRLAGRIRGASLGRARGESRQDYFAAALE